MSENTALVLIGGAIALYLLLSKPTTYAQPIAVNQGGYIPTQQYCGPGLVLGSGFTGQLTCMPPGAIS